MTLAARRFARLSALALPLRRQFEARRGARAVFANSGWLLFDKLIRGLLGILVGAWVARHLGPSQFGLLTYVIAYVAMFQAFANLGADAVVVRDISQHRDSAPEILGSTLVMRLIIGAVCWIAAVASSALISGGNRQIVVMTALVGSALIFQAADVVDLWFQSQSQSRRTVVAKLTTCVMSNGIRVFLVLTDAPLATFAAVTAFDTLAAALALFVAYRRFKTGRPWRWVQHTAKAIWADAWPFMLSGLAIMVYIRVDQIMVKQILGDHSLGIYAAALPLSQFLQTIPLTLAVSLAPLMARRKLLDEKAYRRGLVVVFRLFFYLGVAGVAFTWAISDLLIRGLFGPQYSEAARVLDVHAISNVFCFLGLAHGLWLTNERRFAVRLYGTILAGITTVVMNFILLPQIGVVGAAYAAIAAQVVAAFLINLLLDPQGARMQCDAIFFRKA